MHGRTTDRRRLRALIAARNMTIREAREAAGISKTQMVYVLNGTRDFSDRAALRMAHALKVDVAAFTDLRKSDDEAA
jgi:transcriptional regulator with XRE-family HTH domain